jgi:hypothetical protein
LLLPPDSSSAIGILPPATTTAIIATTPQLTSSFSFLPEKFFRQKKFTDEIIADSKTRAG